MRKDRLLPTVAVRGGIIAAGRHWTLNSTF